jgi:hypothetical protein
MEFDLDMMRAFAGFVIENDIPSVPTIGTTSMVLPDRRSAPIVQTVLLTALIVKECSEDFFLCRS